jgi:hypothetical protein
MVGEGTTSDRTTPQTHTQPSITINPPIKVFACMTSAALFLAHETEKTQTHQVG